MYLIYTARHLSWHCTDKYQNHSVLVYSDFFCYINTEQQKFVNLPKIAYSVYIIIALKDVKILLVNFIKSPDSFKLKV